MNNWYRTHPTAGISYRIAIEVFLPHPLRMGVSDCEADVNVPTFSWFRALLRLRRPHEASRRPPRRPPRMRSRQAGTLAEEANEKSRFPSRKGPRSTESARISIQMITRFCISYLCLLFCRIHDIYIYIILVYFAAVLRYKSSGFFNLWRRFLLREIMTRSQEPHKYQVQGHVNL